MWRPARTDRTSGYNAGAGFPRLRHRPAKRPPSVAPGPRRRLDKSSIDRKSVVWGQSVSVGADLRGRRHIKTKKASVHATTPLVHTSFRKCQIAFLHNYSTTP